MKLKKGEEEYSDPLSPRMITFNNMRRREAMDWIGRMNNWKCGVWLNNLGMN
jgi:hypothetical protein